ncbi:MAG: hypothetical protein KAT00_01515 [Planctomycetes bacterium]|nr:hypothetical protein [Planctomycetota bacterium]
MSKVTVKSIGPAEQKIVQLLISDIRVGDRGNARMARTIRRQFDLRGLTQTMDALVDELQNEIIETLAGEPDPQTIAKIVEILGEQSNPQILMQIVSVLSEQPDPRTIAQIKRNVKSVPWGTLLEAGYRTTGEKELYGDDYGVDKTTLAWLNDRRNAKTTWTWEVNPDGTVKTGDDGKRIPGDVPPEMLYAIAGLDEAITEALATSLETH